MDMVGAAAEVFLSEFQCFDRKKSPPDDVPTGSVSAAQSRSRIACHVCDTRPWTIVCGECTEFTCDACSVVCETCELEFCVECIPDHVCRVQ